MGNVDLCQALVESFSFCYRSAMENISGLAQSIKIVEDMFEKHLTPEEMAAFVIAFVSESVKVRFPQHPEIVSYIQEM